MTPRPAAAKHPAPRRPAPAGPGAGDSGALLGEAFVGWGEQLLTVTDPLEVELSVAALLTQPRAAGLPPGAVDRAVAAVLLDQVAASASQASAALLRAVAAVGSPAQRAAATRGLGAVTERGAYPPAGWADVIGRPVPVEACRRFDVFGDSELIAVTFAYGAKVHAVAVRIDLCRPRVATRIAVEQDAAGLLAQLRDEADPLYRRQDLDLAETRTRLDLALSRCDTRATPTLPRDSLACLPLARARMRRLPAAAQAASAAAAEPSRRAEAADAADRREVVTAFLAQSGPVRGEQAPDPDVLRFWAEVLAGYAGVVPGTPATLVGPLRLAFVLLTYVPSMFELTAARRRGLAASVTSWVRWAAARQGLDDVARDRILADLPTVLDAFDHAYDDADHARQRARVRDVSAGTADGAVLARTTARRVIALPAAQTAAPDAAASPHDISDPAGRRALIQETFADCRSAAGLTGPPFVAAAAAVSEQLWRDDPPSAWSAALRLAAAGVSDHEIIHRLVDAAAAPAAP